MYPHNTPDTQLSFLFYRAHALCANTVTELTRRLWPSCHSDYGGDRTVAVGFLIEQTEMFYFLQAGLNSGHKPPRTADSTIPLCMRVEPAVEH